MLNRAVAEQRGSLKSEGVHTRVNMKPLAVRIIEAVQRENP